MNKYQRSVRTERSNTTERETNESEETMSDSDWCCGV